MDFSGVFAALTTPFAADDSVAIADLKKNIQLYNATGLAGYAVQGSTGESVLLSRAEWDSVLVAAKEAASPQKKLLAGARHVRRCCRFRTLPSEAFWNFWPRLSLQPRALDALV